MARTTTYNGLPKPPTSGHFHDSRRHELQGAGFKTGHLAEQVAPPPTVPTTPPRKEFEFPPSMIDEFTSKAHDLGFDQVDGSKWSFRAGNRETKVEVYSSSHYGGKLYAELSWYSSGNPKTDEQLEEFIESLKKGLILKKYIDNREEEVEKGNTGEDIRKTEPELAKSRDELMKEELKAEAQPDFGISKSDFEAYEHVRSSGVTNMYAVNVVEQYSGLSRDKIMAIMKNYEELMKKYPDVREE